MSDENKSILIAVFGLSQREERILQTICFISKTRLRTYELVSAEDHAQMPDIALVDTTDPKAIAKWKQFSVNHPMLPLLVIGEVAGLDRPAVQIDRPLLATRLLDIFDKVEFTGESPAFNPQPGREPKSEPSTHNNSTKDNSQNIGSSLSALVVDDSLPIRVQLQKELGFFVSKVDLAETGEKALELIAENDYDIIFLDVVLPGVDGYQLCKTIKRDKRTKDVPVVMLTGKATTFDKVRGKLAGCDTYLTKPVELPIFKEVVENYLIQLSDN